MKFRIIAAFVSLSLGVSVGSDSRFKDGDIVYSTVAVLRIRATPDLKGKQIGKLEKGDSLRVVQLAGEEVTVDKIKGRWVQFDYEGKTGYAFEGFLSRKMPLLAHTQKQWVKIEAKNKADVSRRTDAMLAAGDDGGRNPNWGCDELEVFGWPAEYEAGCTDRKLETIRKLKAERGIRTFQAVEAYGDGYCKGWLHRKTMENNCGDLGGDPQESFPIRD
jgi:hypothetical protein